MNRQYIRQNTLPTATDIDNLMDLFREVMFPIGAANRHRRD